MKDWKKVKLGDLLTESKIVSEKPDANKRLTVRLHTEGIEKRPFSKDKKGATKYYIRSKGQFTYGRQNLHKGAFGIVPEKLDGFESSADIPAFDIDKSCLPEWIYYFFKKGNFYLKLESLAKGVGSKRINPSQIYDLDILLPSIEEQKKLLNKTFEISKTFDIAKNEYQKQIKYILQFRQSILHDVITGNLSENWRNSNDVNSKNIELSNGDNSQLHQESQLDIPKTWVECNLSDIVVEISYGTSKKSDYNFGNSYVLRIPNIINGKIDIFDLKSTELTEREIIKYFLKQGDILIIRSNGSLNLVGRSAVVEENAVGFAFAGYLIRIRILDEKVDPYFVYWLLETPLLRTIIEKTARSSNGINNINSKDILSFPILIPPIAEQKYIVSKIQSLNITCEQLEKEAQDSLNNAQKIFDLSLIELFGEEINILRKIENPTEKTTQKRNVKFDNKTMLMDLVELLQKHGKLHGEDLWKMSKFPESIDTFYAELKHQVEDKKTIKEVENEKGYLELV